MVSAAGKLYPGVFIFPRVKVSQKMKDVVPVGWLPLANPSGWMDEDCFLLLLKHLRSQITCSPTKPVLIFVDGHKSHVGYSVVMYCKEQGIILQTLPPHTSHGSQPLDRTCYGPFKRYLKQEHDEFMRKNPGKCITIYDVPIISKLAILKAFTINNIKKGFAATGIFPLNRTAIPEKMYSLSKTTDLPGETIITQIFFVILKFYNLWFSESQSTHCPPVLVSPIDLRNDIEKILPVLPQAEMQYSVTVKIDGGILFFPVANRKFVNPQQLPISSSSLSIPSSLVTSQVDDSVPSTSSTQVQHIDSQEKLVVSPVSLTPLPTVAFPQQNNSCYSNMTVAASTPLHYYESDRLPFDSASPTCFAQQYVDSLSSVVHHFTPCELLPIPKVSQTGPRILKSNKRLGAARNLTSDHKLQKSKEVYEENLKKEKRKQEAALKKANGQGKNKRVTVSLCLYF